MDVLWNPSPAEVLNLNCTLESLDQLKKKILMPSTHLQRLSFNASGLQPGNQDCECSQGTLGCSQG